MNNNIIIANIKIPIEIENDGSLIPILDRKYVEYEKCYNLPPINTDNQSFMVGLKEYIKNNKTDFKQLKQSHNEPEKSQEKTEKNMEKIKKDLILFITKEELNKKPNYNKNNSQSFKRKPNNSHRFTIKHQNAGIMESKVEEGVALSQQQVV